MNRFKHLLLSCLTASGILAGPGVARADNWTGYGTITELVALGDEYVVHISGITNNSTNNPGSCTNGTGVYYFNTAQTTAAGRELMTKTLLAAFLAGKEVSFWVESSAGSNACGTNAPTYYRMSAK